MCRRVGAYVVLSIVAIEAAILIPSYWNYERDLLLRLESTGWAEVAATYRGTVSTSREGSTSRAGDLLARGRLQIQGPGASLLGAVLYRPDGTPIGAIGTPPELTLERAAARGVWKARSADGLGYDVVWEAAETGLPVTIAARLDAGWIGAELTAFIWRITGLVLLISGFVSAVTMAILGRAVLLPLLRLRASLTAARDDPANADTYLLDQMPGDELGEAMDAANRLLHRVARTHREELATMTDMASQASDAILAYDGAGRILYANPACLLLCGFADTAEMEAAGLPRFGFKGEGREVTLPDSLASGAYSREALLIAHGGRRVPTFVNAARPHSDADASVQFYASITDISELHAAKQRLKRQNLELKTANRAKSEFLANMSHELRTPLNAIIGFSEVLRDGLFGPLGNVRYADYAQDIHTSGIHLLNIINDILDLAKIEAGKMELHEAEVVVADLVEAVLPIVRERAVAGGLTLGAALPDDPPMLRADPRAVKQILINLLSNAIKFTEPGGAVTVSAALDRDMIVISVTDTGIGMAEADLSAALDAFGQIDGSLDRKHEGTGLGLPLVASLAELHGAVLKLDSEPGVGTTAAVVFPARRTVTGPAHAAQKTERAAQKTARAAQKTARADARPRHSVA